MAKKSRKKASKNTRKKDPGPIRAAIMAEIEKQKLTGYRLVELLKGKVSRTAVYRFISDGASCDVETAEEFFGVLGIKIK